jgi:predicted ATP-dependent Lon-type protease
MQSESGLDDLDVKLNQVLNGKVVRKDLLHRIKTGTNVPTFVLEFLLARYCASDDPAEIQAGMEAVLATLQENYVRPDESNAAQSRVAMKGRHKFIDKVHVRYGREGEAALGVTGELRFTTHRHRREILSEQRPAPGGWHLGRGGDRP